MEASVWTEWALLNASAPQASPANVARATSTSASPNRVLDLAPLTVSNFSTTTSATAGQVGGDVSARSGLTSAPPILVQMAGLAPSPSLDTSAPALKASPGRTAASTAGGNVPQHLVEMEVPAWQILTARLATDVNVQQAQMDRSARLTL